MKPIFNKIFVIESLANETLTGKILANDMEVWKFAYEAKTGINLQVRHIPALTEADFISALKDIRKEAESGVIPVVHLEMHGVVDPDTNIHINKYLGVCTAGDKRLITWNRLADLLREINIACRNNLLLTMAVCYGAWLQKASLLDKEAVTSLTVGSLHKVFNGTILLKYTDFYEKLLCDADYDAALDGIRKENPNLPDNLGLIDSYEMFRKVYANYIAHNVEDPAGVSQRIRQMELENPWLKYMFGDQSSLYIWRMVEHTKQQYYLEHARKFLMIDRYPENAIRFPLPQTTDELLKQQTT